MVLQRDVPVPVWGMAIPGANIEVEFAGQIVKTEAGADGQWKIRLKALSANAQPRALRMTASLTGGQTENVTLTNVLVGEVWVAAGQSNMEWPLERDEFAAETLAAAELPGFRLLNLDFVTKYGFGRPFTPEQISRLTPSGFFRGAWMPSTPDAARPFSAVAFHFGRELQRELNLSVGIIHLAVGGSPTEAWIRREAFQSVKSLQPLTAGNWLTNTLLGPWCRERGLQNLARPEKDGLAIPGDSLGPNHPFKPAFLWEAGIAPLLPFAMRGVIWYQGESNAEEQWRVQQHEDLFPLLVGDWRAQWGMGDFPFLFCQLSSISTEKGYKAEFWPEFRDSQRRMLARIPNSAMAVTSDVGHPTDVHPRNKRAVGQRLALAALGQVYGQGNEISGPLFASASRRGTELVLRFHHAKDRQSTDGLPPIGFEVGGTDGRFHPATARIENDTVVLDISRVVSPTSVRFGWQPYPRPPLNLINGVGLPASTFQARISTTELN